MIARTPLARPPVSRDLARERQTLGPRAGPAHCLMSPQVAALEDANRVLQETQEAHWTSVEEHHNDLSTQFAHIVNGQKIYIAELERRAGSPA